MVKQHTRPILSPRKAPWSSGTEKTPSGLKIDSLRAVTDEQAAHLPQTICLAPAGEIVFLGDCTEPGMEPVPAWPKKRGQGKHSDGSGAFKGFTEVLQSQMAFPGCGLRKGEPEVIQDKASLCWA